MIGGLRKVGWVPLVVPVEPRVVERQMSSVPCTEEEFAHHDVLVVANAHAAVRQPTLDASAQLAVDTRNLFGAGTLSCPVVRA